jgi:hypothetical protein
MPRLWDVQTGITSGWREFSFSPDGTARLWPDNLNETIQAQFSFDSEWGVVL